MTDSARTGKPGLAARRAALQILRGVLEDRTQMSDLVASSGFLSGLAPEDRARAQRLATTTLRHLGQADTLIDRYVDKSPPVPARNILRLAAVELCVLGEAAHGVVDSAVTLMRKNRKGGQMTGLANAVLRKIADEGAELWAELPPQTLPKWLRRRIVHIYDEQIVRDIEAAHLRGAPLDLTLKNDLDPVEWAASLQAEILPTGTLRIDRSAQVTDLPGYHDGSWWVQDAAAALPVRMLGNVSGLTALDLCAAPGGKTLQLISGGAEVTALDHSQSRMKRLRENMRRTNLDAKVVVADALEWQAEEQFDLVVLDAPCSATGTIRRHPDLPFVKTGKELHDVFALQSDLIDRAVDLLKPGGRLLYCTCSLLTEEGERQAKLAIERHGLLQLPVEIDALGVPETWVRDGGGLRTRPDLWQICGGIDGFFMIVLKKPVSC
ncbi:RsmB/NOP family class I SAM-dependent RNA methyltransferase [Litoreibacter roseus]|uniref:16S rRNA methyltransferase n=1 Tax=Litoreibacter roseus TaxID=2601869 RepID=A0A6N6JKC9_9RHOB|nr:RsmB/NOP family class I SAM-dependent RNA methyltransferase [Litoreibacter roseus]GFE66310.1 16S rRNA methyltransferase [Litoreibacter roseus]